MSWPVLLLMLLGAIGITVVISLSKIAAPVRRIWPSLLNCPLCTGTWVGLAVGLLFISRRHLPPAAVSIAEAIAFAFSAALLAYIAGTWLREHDRPHD